MRVTAIISTFLYSLFAVVPVAAQNTNSFQADTARIMKLIDTSERFRFFKPDSVVPYAEKALQLSRSINFKMGELEAYTSLGEHHRVSGNYPEALENLFAALRISNEIHDSARIAGTQVFIGITYLNLKEYQTGLQYLFQAYANKEYLPAPVAGFALANTGMAYREMNMLDSALIYQKMAWSIAQPTTMNAGKSFALRELGNIYDLRNQPDSAFYYYRYSLTVTNDILNIGRTYSRMAMLFQKLGQDDSVVYFANQALSFGRRSLQKPTMLEASTTLFTFYIGKRQLDSAIKYQQLVMTLKDSLFGPEKIRRLQLFAINEQKRLHEVEQKQQKIEQDQRDYENNLRFYGLLGVLSVFILIGIILYRGNRRQKTANVLLQHQKKETELTLRELKATQSQLIQSEKMASLGELTAGIAHEIQNPLNFVNNFSEVNTELIDDLETEASKGNLEEVKAIAKDLKDNEQKINHHGKRADAIVKGMLQHSRSSTSQKEPTDINALCDEYLRLAFHGLRAKDKSFNAIMKTHFDESIGKIQIIRQDIGRVILNLINNAFYAVTEKEKQNPNGYEPTILVSTKSEKDKVEVKVKDNGNGIPQKILDKIFQPFFTTKPTGQGTGLGLSLAYDIVKAHGGELKVDTKEGEGSEFIIQLPA